MPPLDVDSKLSCAGCLQGIESRQFLQCSFCSKHYDLMCANVSEKRFYSFYCANSDERKENWVCQECKAKSKTTIPTEAALVSSDMTTRSRAKNKSPKVKSTSPSVSASAKVSPPATPDAAASSELVSELRLLRKEMKAARSEMQDFRSAIAGLTAAVNMCNQRIDDLSERVDAIENQQREREEREESSGNVVQLEKIISDLKLDLNDRDQAALCNDIELAGISEEMNENAVHLVLNMSAKLGVALDERDIVSAERAGPLRVVRVNDGPPSSDRARPRPLVVRLARRVQRDQLLAAARVRRGVNTEGITSAVSPFFVNERLTRHNRVLFYKARADASSAQWKYVWTRDGNVYARKEQGSPRLRLRSDADLCKVFGI